MQLGELLIREREGLQRRQILLLRHSPERVQQLEAVGGSLEEYTAIQPVASRYDFLHPGKPPIAVVVAMVGDQVRAVYQVLGVLREGLNTVICSRAYRQFEEESGKSARWCRRYALKRLPSGALGKSIAGWERRARITVQRGGESFFDNIKVRGKPLAPSHLEVPALDQEWLEGAPRLRTHLRRERAAGLAQEKRAAFIREKGHLYCERCGMDPVKQYGTQAAESCIEVHHQAVPVAKMLPGAKTTLAHLLCLCANCHRLTHREMRDTP